jgi:hypothetical protein
LKYGIKTDFIEIGWGGIDRSHLAQDSDQWRDPVNMKMNPFGAHKRLGTPLEAISTSRTQFRVVSFNYRIYIVLNVTEM